MDLLQIGMNKSDSLPDFNDFASQVLNNVIQQIRNSTTSPNNFLEHWTAFSSAINWRNDNWLIFVILSHLVLLCVSIIFRNNHEVLAILLFSICLLVGFAEKINSFCAINWSKFATQNYFDEHGVFASVFFCSPLLFIGFLQLVCVITVILLIIPNQCLISFI